MTSKILKGLMVKIRYLSFIILSIIFSCQSDNKISFNDLFKDVKKEFSKQTFNGVTQFGEVKKSGQADTKEEKALYMFSTDSLMVQIIKNEVADTFSIYVLKTNSNVDDEIIKNKITKLFELTDDLKIENYEKNYLTGECNFYFYLNDVKELPNYTTSGKSISNEVKKYGVLTYVFDKEKYINSDIFKKQNPVELEDNWYIYYF